MAMKTLASKEEEQQLYMLELLVDQLNLTPEKIQQIGPTPLSVRLEFLDFPIFEINEEEFWSAKKQKDTSLLSKRKNKDGSLDFRAGKSCLFPKKPSELVEAMRTKPLKVGVYKHTKKEPCKFDENETPVCKSEFPLSECLCDQVAMAGNDSKHLPKPYVLRNTWNLIDEEKNPSGTILLFLRLSCLGKSIVTKFAVQEKSFLFKSPNSSNEFQCSKVPVDDERVNNPIDENHVDAPTKPGILVGLAPVCQELSKQDGGILETVPPFKLSIHRSIEERCPKECDAVVRSSPNGECNVQANTTAVKKMLNNFSRMSNTCNDRLCTGIETIDSMPKAYQAGLSSSSHFHTGNCFNYRGNYVYRPRMRGGGPLDDDNFDCKREKWQMNRIPLQSTETLVSGACKSPLKTNGSSKPGCGCFGKLGTGMMGTNLAPTNSGAACSNNPCLGVDCLIRAFKETQEFVDSIGKVPGLAGLGLMDPAESPFFGRERDEASTSCLPQIDVSPTNLGLKSSSVYPSTLLNIQTTKRGVTGAMSPILPVALGGLASSVHRDPLEKLKKKTEERNEKQKETQEAIHQNEIERESGPCAEPRCKSRKKKPEAETLNENSTSDFPTATKTIDFSKKLQASRIRSRTHERRKISRMPGGPGGDHVSAQRNSHIRVSKKIMRFVNAMRDSRFCHGHKNCLDVRIRVPGNMGWLWNSNEVPGNLKTPIGWKPGAISKFVWDRLQEAKATNVGTGSSGESRPTTPSKGKRGKPFRTKSLHSLGRSQWARNRMLEKDDEEIELPPTLHIHRKDGTYYVTMYPVKTENVTDPEAGHQEPVKPLQFKITKNKDDLSVCSSSTASDMEIEFSPPAAINRYTIKAPHKEIDTQVTQQEILNAQIVNAPKRPSKTKKIKIKK